MRIKIGFLILIIFFLFLMSVNAFAEQSILSLVEKVQPATVLITVYDAQGNQIGQGSGFFVSPKGEVITNWHVISDASSAMVKTSTGAMFKVKGVVAKDEKRDLVKIILDAKDIDFPYLNLSATIPKVGEKIVVIGSPFGLESTVSDGIVSAIRTIPDVGKIIQLTAPISSGSSGSPAINLKGQVIGVATFQFVKGQNLNFAISSIDVVKLSKVAESLTPLSSLFLQNKPYLSRINPEVQLKENSWIKITNEFVVEQTPEVYCSSRKEDETRKICMSLYGGRKLLKELYVYIQFLKPCIATTIRSNNPFEDLGKALAGDTDYILPKFRCDYRTKVFVTYFTNEGYEINTDGQLPAALWIDDFYSKRKTEMFPGEQIHVNFLIPEEAKFWYVWVPK